MTTTKTNRSSAKKTTKKTVAKKTATKKTTSKVVSQRNAVLFQKEIHVPTNSVRISKTATEKWKGQGGKGCQRVTQRIKMKDPDQNKDWDCIANAKTWKNKLAVVINRYTLDLSFRGANLVSVHLLETFREKLKELEIELEEIKSDFITTLPQMIENDRQYFGDDFDPNLYPTEAEIQGYGVRKGFSKLSTDLFPEESSELLDTAEREKTSRLVNQFAEFTSSICKYIDGEANRFKEASIENVITEAEVLKQMDLGHENQEKFVEVCDKVISLVNQVNAPAIREAKQKLEKASPEADTKETREFLEKQNDTLNESLAELEKECKGLF